MININCIDNHALDMPSQCSKLPVHNYDIVQLCHGKVTPAYSSGYSLRCNELALGMNRVMISLFGPAVRNDITGEAVQLRANILLANAFLRGNRSFEILLSQGRYLSSKYRKIVDPIVLKSKCVILEGPWHFRLVKELIKDKIVIYDAHNFESGLRRENKYYEYVRELEMEACDSADLILSVTQEDTNQFIKTYNVPADKIRLLTHVPLVNECDWKGANGKTIIFIGSLYEGNIRAYREVEKLAVALPSFNFVVLGSICSMPGKKKIQNIRCLGVVKEQEKDKIMASSMLAINPIVLGSGRNVKMVDYLAHGLPIISTKLGIRGFVLGDIEKAVRISEIDEFSKVIRDLDKNREVLDDMSLSAHKIYHTLIHENSQSFGEIYNDLLSKSMFLQK